jgi:hypothetical protein
MVGTIGDGEEVVFSERQVERQQLAAGLLKNLGKRPRGLRGLSSFP